MLEKPDNVSLTRSRLMLLAWWSARATALPKPAAVLASANSMPFGNKAKPFTADRVFGETVTVNPTDRDKYGRTVALIRSDNDPVTLNEVLVRQG